MRFVSLVLTVLVLMMCAVPTFEYDDCISHRIKTTQEDGHRQDHEGSDCCSPFTACNACSGFTIPMAHRLASHQPTCEGSNSIHTHRNQAAVKTYLPILLAPPKS